MSIKQEWDEGSILHRPKMPNKYITFCSFYKQILDKEYAHLKPQEKAVKAGELWRFLPNELKNSFEIYASNENLLKQQNSKGKNKERPILPYPRYQTIFDSNVSNQSSNSEEDQIFNEMYNMCINENA